MSIKKQTEKNIDLSEKLFAYLLKSSINTDFPEDVSFVPFSNNDMNLNKANQELLDNILKSKKPVAKAQEPSSASGKWEITPLNF